MTQLTAEQSFALESGLSRGGRTGWQTETGEPVDIRAEPGYATFVRAYDNPTPTPDSILQDEDDRR